MVFVFWFSLSVLIYIYLGYPAALWLLSLFRRRPVAKGENLPRVTAVISAFNEERHIRETVENKLAQDYPADMLNVTVVSDGSTDRTDAIVEELAGPRVKLIRQTPRQGKTAALNRAVAESAADIIVFSDANSLYRADAVRNLVRNFSDPAVGYVTGKMVYVDAQGSLVGSGCSAYMRYENVLRALETQTASVVGVDGGVDAVRRALYEPMTADMLPDFVLPLRVAEKGYRVVYEENAFLQENALSRSTDEWAMRVRVILRSFHALWAMRAVMNPARHGLFAVQVISHKLLRYFAVFFQALVFAANVVLLDDGPLYVGLFIGQVLFYALAGGGWIVERAGGNAKIFLFPYYFCLLNGASFLALVKFLRGQKQVTWMPRKG